MCGQKKLHDKEGDRHKHKEVYILSSGLIQAVDDYVDASINVGRS